MSIEAEKIDEWPMRTAESFSPFITSGSRGWAKYYADHGDLFMRITNLKRHSIKPNLSDMQYVKLPVSEKEGLRTGLCQGDILISITADIGIIGYIDASIPIPSYINQHIACIRLPADQVLPKFVAYYLSSAEPQRRFIEMTDVGAKTGINLTTVKKLTFPCPPFREQEAIAEALSDADALIEGLERLIAKKRLIKQGAMQELLTPERRRLPRFSGEWETKHLGDVALVVMGQSPSSATYNTSGRGLPLIQGAADVTARKTIKRIFTTEITKLGKLGDIILTVRAPVGEVSKAEFDLCLGRGVCAVRTDDEFLYHTLIHGEGAWSALSKGSTFDSVNSEEVRGFEIRYPLDCKERKAIANVLTDMDSEIQAIETRLEKARAIKEGMMQNLLTGRIRLI